uniref:Putative secreted protein n=1 Tax=Anopheles darlingi TaxID=43151 RepID=A0A2M4DAM1_ANODA
MPSLPVVATSVTRICTYAAPMMMLMIMVVAPSYTMMRSISCHSTKVIIIQDGNQDEIDDNETTRKILYHWNRSMKWCLKRTHPTVVARAPRG